MLSVIHPAGVDADRDDRRSQFRPDGPVWVCALVRPQPLPLHHEEVEGVLRHHQLGVEEACCSHHLQALATVVFAPLELLPPPLDTQSDPGAEERAS